MKKLINIFIGIVCFLYWFVPVAQYLYFDGYADRVNDHGGIFRIPNSLFFSTQIISPVLAYLFLLGGAIGSFFFLRFIVNFILIKVIPDERRVKE